jgi:O-acetyl-ADP-ribose deacetylase (regulator of RNase III)
VPIHLTHRKLQQMQVDAIGYGAKSTGGMGGGAANAVLVAAGPAIREDLRFKLAFTSRQIGSVVVTEGHGLEARGIRWVCHIVSILKGTPEGDWCPHPEMLAGGVEVAIRRVLKLGGTSLAISALGTGEGRVPPARAAEVMLLGARTAMREAGDRGRDFQLHFSLPSLRDFIAFEEALGGRQAAA